MSLTTLVKVSSVRKYLDGSYTGQVVSTDSNNNQVLYYCRINPGTKSNRFEFDSDNVYMLIGGKWQKTPLYDDLLNVVSKPFLQLVENLGHLYVRGTKDAKGRECLSMWRDTVINVGRPKTMEGHLIKIGDMIFKSKDPMTLVAHDQRTISYTRIGQDGVYELNLLNNTDIATRLLNQFDIAYAKYERARDSRPIGFGSWDQLQDARKEFGKSNRNAKELARSRA